MATSKTPQMRFVGGPLDGQTKPKTATGRWSKYLDNQGSPLNARVAERMLGFGSDRLYEQTGSPEFADDGAEVRTYTHRSAK